MKQKTIAILLTIALLAGCNTPAPAAPSAAEPDMEAIIQQSVDEAVKERLEQIEEEQRKKDEEIERAAGGTHQPARGPPGGTLLRPC